MNKQELIDAIAGRTGEAKATTNQQLDAVFNVIMQTLVKGDTVQLMGFGSFSSGSRAARIGRNPATGQEIKVAARKTVKFTAGKQFKAAVNKGREEKA